MAATTSLDDAYALQRQQALQQGTNNKQQASDALKRRFAAIGNLNSGAYVKAQEQSDQNADVATNQAVQGVDLQKAQTAYQSQEAQKGRDFTADQNQKNLAFQQQVFGDESKYRGLNYQLQQKDFDASQQANKLNAASSLGQLSDEQLRQLGSALPGGSTAWGQGGNTANIAAILKKYGYG